MVSLGNIHWFHAGPGARSRPNPFPHHPESVPTFLFEDPLGHVSQANVFAAASRRPVQRNPQMRSQTHSPRVRVALPVAKQHVRHVNHHLCYGTIRVAQGRRAMGVAADGDPADTFDRGWDEDSAAYPKCGSICERSKTPLSIGKIDCCNLNL